MFSLSLKSNLIIFLALISLLIGAYVNAAIIIGNSKGSITLTEVFDYQCPHCHRMQPIIDALIKTNPDVRARLMPVAIINHNSITEAAAAIAMSKLPDQFNAFTQLVMRLPPLTSAEIKGMLTKMNLNTPGFKKTMHQSWVRSQLMEGLNTLKQFHTTGVPLILIYPTNHPNEMQVYYGEQSLQTLQTGINHARKHT